MNIGQGADRRDDQDDDQDQDQDDDQDQDQDDDGKSDTTSHPLSEAKITELKVSVWCLVF